MEINISVGYAYYLFKPRQIQSLAHYLSEQDI